MKSRTKDIRMSSISNEFREHGIQRASYAWTAHINKDNSRALHKNCKGF